MEVYERPWDRLVTVRSDSGSRGGEQHPSGIWNLAIPDSDIVFSSLPDIGSPNDTDDRVMCPDIGPGVCNRADSEQAVVVLA